MTQEVEGVIKYRAEHEQRPLSFKYNEAVGQLTSWRRIMTQLGVIGRDPQRYDGAGFGNISLRAPPFGAGPGRRPFLITATQSAQADPWSAFHVALVERYDARTNWVQSSGEAQASSEAMTHGSIYDGDPSIRAVVHVHAPSIWHADLGLPETPKDIEYGTSAMALTVRQLMQRHRNSPVWRMAGHEDGIITFGTSLDRAGLALVAMLAQV